MSASPATIDRDELYDKITRRDPFHLFEVLPVEWRRHHLPGAIHLPPNRVLETVSELVPDRNAEIVLYCWDDDCPTSAWAARELEAMGYHNIREYVDGKADWLRAGMPVER